jgi:hypothetical protein
MYMEGPHNHTCGLHSSFRPLTEVQESPMRWANQPTAIVEQSVTTDHKIIYIIPNLRSAG